MSGDRTTAPRARSAVPNPGSDEAREQDCICPRMDNAHGRGWMGGNGKDWTDGGIYVVVEGCPLHTLPPERSLVPEEGS